MSVWIIVANASAAKIFEMKERGKAINFVKAFENPEGQLKNHELKSDRSGRSYESAGAGQHAMQTEVSPKEQVQQAFAKEIAEFCNHEASTNHFTQLYLVAPAQFLGFLRQSLSKQVEKMLQEQSSKNLIGQQIKDEELAELLKKELDLGHHLQ